MPKSLKVLTLTYNKFMGCECLGPRRSQQQVYLKLIRQLHEESSKLSLSETSASDCYASLLQRFTKKGDLRKLSDNLSSRKNKVQQAMVYNMKLTAHTKLLSRSCCGLLIADSISEVVYHRSNSMDLQTSSKSQISSEMSIVIMKKSSLSKNTQLSNKKMSMSQHHKHLSANAGFDEQYLKLVKFLHCRDANLRKRVLDSTNNFCENHVGVLNCDSEVWSFIAELVSNICDGIEVEASCLTFKNLLRRTRDQLSEHVRDRKNIQTLISVWLKQSNSLDVSSIKDSCYQMLSIYVHKFMSAWEAEFIYETLISFFDKIQFHRIDEPLLQKLFEDLVENSDLKTHFQRALFNYLIGYLSIGHDNYITRKWLVSCLGIKVDNIRLLCKNANKLSVKLETLKRCNAWIDKKYVDVNQFCLYNNKAAIYVYQLAILSFQAQKLSIDPIVAEYIKLFSKLSPESQQRLIQALIQQFQEHQISKNEQESIFLLTKSIVQKSNKYMLRPQYCLLPIYTECPTDKKLEMIKFNQFMLDYLPPQQLAQLELKNRQMEILCCFYQNIANQNCELMQKYSLLLHFLQYLANKKINKQMLTAYYRVICQKSNENTKKFNIQTQFCLIVFGFKIKQILTSAAIPTRLAHLYKKMEICQSSNEIFPDINSYFFDRDVLANDISVVKQKEQVVEQYEKQFGRFFEGTKTSRIDSIDKRETLSKRQSLLSDNQASNGTINDQSFQQAINILTQ